MVRFRVDEEPEGIAIQVADVSGHHQELLEAFQECQAGRCTCPTDEYEKLAEMEIATTDDGIELKLKAKPDSRFDRDEISACLEYTASKVKGP